MSYEYIRGLIDGEGCFTFHTGFLDKNGIKTRVPAFAIRMHEREEPLFKEIKEFLNLKSKIHNLKAYTSDGHKRGRQILIQVRDFRQLRDIIIPLCNKKLRGYKAKQFDAWIEEMDSDTSVPKQYKLLARLCKNGFFEKEERYKKFSKTI